MRSRFVSVLCVLALVAIPVTLMADPPESVGHTMINASGIDWVGNGAHDKLVLTVQQPDGTNFTKEFNSAASANLRLNDFPGGPQNGLYHYDLLLVPRIPAGVVNQLRAARA